MLIKIKKTTEVETEVEIPVPSFFRNKEETWYVGLLNEKTVVEIRCDNFETTVRNYNNEMWKAGVSAVEFAYNNFHGCTETEFMNKFEEVLGSLSLRPEIVL